MALPGILRRDDAFVIAAIVALVGAVYWPTAGFDFLLWDDDGYVARHPRVRMGLSLESVAWAFTTFDMSNWHPLTWISYLVDASLFGEWAGGFHLTNVVWHGFNCLLLFALLRRLTREISRPALAALLFAIHPMHVESVAWVSERKDVLSMAFGLMALHAYVSYARRPSLGRFAAVAALFAASLMSKPMLVTLPVLLLLLDYWPLRRAAGPTLARLLLEKLPLLALSAASSAVTLVAQQAGGSLRSLEQISLGDRLANAVSSYVTYLGKALWPSGLAFFQVFSPPSAPEVAGALVVLTVLSAWTFRERHRNPALVVGWLWFLAALVPVIGIIQVGEQAWASRYAYVPFVGLYIMLCWALPMPIRGGNAVRTTATVGACALAVLALSASAAFEVRHWRDSQTLFSRALRVEPGNFVAHTLLAEFHSERGRADLAERHAREALTASDGKGFAAQSALLVLSRVFMDTGRYELAERALDEAERMGSRSPTLHYNRGTLALLRGEPGASLAHFDRAIALNPAYSEALNNRGAALARLGRLAEAVQDHSDAVAADPFNYQAYYNLGVALEAQGASGQAIAAFGRSVALAQRDLRPRLRLAKLLLRVGRIDEARAQYAAVLAIDPANADAARVLGQLTGR